MDGKYLNKKEISLHIGKWLEEVLKTQNGWEGNNLHIDEIKSLKEINRTNWVDISFEVFDIAMKQFIQKNMYLIFLHIELEGINQISLLKDVSKDFLIKNINEFTPPSLNVTSKKYFEEFYSNELILLKQSFSANNTLNLDFYLRQYYDKIEQCYSREIYIFSSAK